MKQYCFHTFSSIRKHPLQTCRLKSLYIRRGQPFPEVELFIKKSAERFAPGSDVSAQLAKHPAKELMAAWPMFSLVFFAPL